MNRRQFIFGAIVAGSVAIVGGVLGYRQLAPGAEVELNVLYSTEKEQWLKEVAADFEASRPAISGGYRIKVNLQKVGSNELVAQVLDGSAKPDVISPASSLQIALLQDESAKKFGKPLVVVNDSQQCQASLHTPLVFVGWKERMDVLWPKGIDANAWQQLQTAASDSKGWAAFGKPEWGYLKFSHTDPQQSNSGLQSLVLMTYAYFNKTSGLTANDVLSNPEYQKWFAGFEQSISQFGNSTGDYMREIVTYGPSKYDLVTVYEATAIEYAASAQSRYGALQVYYPPATLMSDHPFCVLNADWVSQPKREAAQAWVKFLLSKPAQEKALQYGYRPVNAEVLMTQANSPFVRYQTNGIRTDLPAQADVPPGDVLSTLLSLWQRSTKR